MLYDEDPDNTFAQWTQVGAFHKTLMEALEAGCLGGGREGVGRCCWA